MAQWVWIGIAGAFGALARYGLTRLVQHLLGNTFPWGTFTVNILGSFLFGMVWMMIENHASASLSPQLRLIFLTGFMGGFTTFSSFMFETSTLIGQNQWGLVFVNLLLQTALGLLALFVGFAVGRWF